MLLKNGRRKIRMKKKYFFTSIILLLVGITTLTTSINVYAQDYIEDSSVMSASIPRSITYSREFHIPSSTPSTKYYRTTQYGRSYAGYLTFQRKTGKNYGLYTGRLYIEGTHIPVPMALKIK